MESQTSDLKQRMGLGAGGRLRWLPPSAHVPTSPSQISSIYPAASLHREWGILYLSF